MNFEINEVINNMKNAAVDSVKDDVEIIPGYLDRVFENEKEALKELTEARLTGEISEAEFRHELERLKLVFETEMLTVKIITKTAAQKAVNAAIAVLEKAVNTAIGGIL